MTKRNYQILPIYHRNTLEFEKIMKTIKADVNLKDPDIYKTYKILSFLIKYINEHGKKGYIGYANIKKKSSLCNSK